MAQIDTPESKAELKLTAIDLINGTLHAPTNNDVSLENLNFNVNIDSKVDTSKKILYVIVKIDIKNDDQTIELGNLAVRYTFKVFNFDDIIKIDENGKMDIPKKFIDIINSISLSTTRGVMFTTFKGTFLHAAILPILDPQLFQNNQ